MKNLNKTVNMVLVIILIILGFFLAVAHQAHEQIGLGTDHTMHTIVGVILIVLAVGLWYWDRKKK